MSHVSNQEKSVEEKSPGADTPRLASTVFFRVFRGSDSSRGWVAGEARNQVFRGPKSSLSIETMKPISKNDQR